MCTYSQCSCYKSSRLKWLVAPSYSAIHFLFWCKMSIFHVFFVLLLYWSIIFHWTPIKATKQNSVKRPATNQITAELNCSCVSFAEILFFYLVCKFNAGTFILPILFDQFRSASNRLNAILLIKIKYFANIYR